MSTPPLTPEQRQWLAEFAEVSEEELEQAVSVGRAGPMLQVAGAQPNPIGLRLGAGQGDYWGQEPNSGMTVQEWRVQSARGLPRLNAQEQPMPGPNGDVATRVRIHSPDPAAPAGSNSAEGWTMNIEQNNARMTQDGTWFDPRYERGADGARIDVRPYQLQPDGTVVEAESGTPVADPEIVQAVRTSNANMDNSHIPLFPDDTAPLSGPAPSEPAPSQPTPSEPPPAPPPEEAPVRSAAAGGMAEAARGGVLAAGIAGGMALAQDWDKVKSGQMSAGDAALDAGGKAAETGGLTFGGSLVADAVVGGSGGEAAAIAGAGGDALAGAAGGEAGAVAGAATSVASVALKGGVIGGVVAGGMALVDDVGKVKSGQMTAGTATVDVTAKTAIGVGAGLAGAAAGAEIGAAVGTFIPIPVVGTVVGLVAGAVVGGAVGYVGSKIMDTEIGKEVVAGAGKAVDAAIDGVEDAGKFVAKEAGAALDAVEADASKVAKAVGGAAVEAAAEAQKAAKFAAKEAGKAAAAVEHAASKAAKAVEDAASKAAKAVEAEAGKAAKAVEGAASKAVKKVEDAGKFVAKEAGAAVNAVEGAVGKAEKAVEGAASKAADAVEGAVSGAWDKVTSLF